jgi:hypothetical protein
MSYVDLAIGLAFFLFFLSLVLILAIQQFVEIPTELTIEEFRERAVVLFEEFFSTMGVPGDWEDSEAAPSELGLATIIYRIPITVKERGTSDRTDEPVVVRLFFDDECLNNAWNDTMRVYDSNLTEHKYELVNPVFCSGQLLNESYIRFKANVSQSQEEVFYVYYSDDNEIPGPIFTINFSTDGWMPPGGDIWSESITFWSRHGGDSVTAQTSTTKMRGIVSIEIQDIFDNEKLGLKYDPASSIVGISNGWYIDAWIYVDDLAGISAVNVSISDGSDTIVSSISSSSMDSAAWYHFERNLTSSQWESWTTFDASNGIDNIIFYMVNSSAGLTRQMRVDEVHFELEPMDIKKFPEEEEIVISQKKIDALNNLTYSELRDVTGEDYRFRIEIVGQAVGAGS